MSRVPVPPRRRLRFRLWAWIALVGVGQVARAQPAAFDPTPLARTYSILRSATPGHRRSLRVLFYGQSITLQPWHLALTAFLQTNYPSVDFTVADPALNGHTTDRLVQTAWADMYPWRADLIIFYAFGSEDSYEKILRELRSQTTADILLQNNHIASWDPEPRDTADTPVDKLVFSDNDWHSYVYLPKAAARFAAAVADIRTPWKAYLRAHHLSLNALTYDGLHLNDAGNQLMATLMAAYFDPAATGVPTVDPYAIPGVASVAPGRDGGWKGRRFAFRTVGSRIEALLGPGAPATLSLLVDGKPPSAFDGCFTFSRSIQYGNYGNVIARRVDSQTHLVSEDWLATVTRTQTNGAFSFDLRGSKTGFDGSGSTSSRFVSTSGRVVLETNVWDLTGLPPGYLIGWASYQRGADSIRVAPPVDDAAESSVLMADGLPDGPHQIQILADTDAVPAVKAFYIYSPAVRAGPAETPPVVTVRSLAGPANSGGAQLSWPGSRPAWLWQSAPSAAGPWSPAAVPAAPAVTEYTVPFVTAPPAGFFRLTPAPDH